MGARPRDLRLKVLASAIVAAVRFVPSAWRCGWAALVPTAIAIAGSIIAAGHHQSASAFAAWLTTTGALAVVSRGVLWREALAKGRPRGGGLHLGFVELRIAAVWALSLLFLGILGLLLVTGLLCLVYAIASAGRGFDPANAASWAAAVDTRGRIVIGAAMVAGVAAITVAMLRISLAEAASVAGEKLQVLSSWPFTRGGVLAIGTGNLVLAAAPVGVLLVSLATPGYWGWFRALATGFVVAGVWLPMQVGLMANAYERRAGSAVG